MKQSLNIKVSGYYYFSLFHDYFNVFAVLNDIDLLWNNILL